MWVSVSVDLRFDAERDLRDLGASHVAVHALHKLGYQHVTTEPTDRRHVLHLLGARGQGQRPQATTRPARGLVWGRGLPGAAHLRYVGSPT